MQPEGGKKFTFRTVPAFWKSFDGLTAEQQVLAKETFKEFKKDPFAPKLRAHKINRLTALYRVTVFSVSIAGDLRAVFYRKGNEIVSLDIGTHDIYK